MVNPDQYFQILFMKQIPNLFTLLNLFCGCVAIVFVLQYNPKGGLNLSGIALLLGSVFIFIAAIIDFLDGFVARLFKATSAMGEQLDSLADIVSFGVAPAMILFKLLEVSYTNNPQISEPLWLQLPAFIVPCAGAWRLARFNLDKEQRYYFKGVPIPAVGLTIASLPLANAGPLNVENIYHNPLVIYGIIILLSWLMVSNIPMISLKFKSTGVKDNADKISLLLISLIAILLFQWSAIPFIFVAYVILSLIFRPKM